MALPDPRKYIKDPSELLQGLEMLRDDAAEFQATRIPDNANFLWRLVHLNPALYRGIVVAVVMVLGSFGLVVTGNQTDAIATGLVAVVAIVQAIWTHRAVTPNAKVVVFKPNPVDQPRVVASGEAVSMNAPAVLQAASTNSVQALGVLDLPPMGPVL